MIALLLAVLLLPSTEAEWLASVQARVEAGDAAGALQSAQQGLAAHPRSVPLLKAAGRLLLQDRRRSALAKDPLSKAVQLAPGDPEAHYYLSQWACLHNVEQQCITEARQALRLAPGNAQADLQLNTLIGIAAEKLGRAAEAERAFRKSLERNRQLGLPDPLSAYQYLDFLLKRARDAEAQEVAALLLEKAPSFGPAHLERAKWLAKKGKTEEAIALAEKALELQGMDGEKLRAAHALLARSYFLLGREVEALRHQQWIENNPG